MAKQSRSDRVKRLEDGRCPIHGITMYQIGLKEDLFVVKCTRKSCSIKAFESEPFGNATLFTEFQSLIA